VRLIEQRGKKGVGQLLKNAPTAHDKPSADMDLKGKEELLLNREGTKKTLKEGKNPSTSLRCSKPRWRKREVGILGKRRCFPERKKKRS